MLLKAVCRSRCCSHTLCMPSQGVTGGVTSFPEFEEKFFPQVLGQQGGGQGVTYCQYDNQALQLFTFSLYLAGIFSTLVGGYTSRYACKGCPLEHSVHTNLCAAVSTLVIDSAGRCAYKRCS